MPQPSNKIQIKIDNSQSRLLGMPPKDLIDALDSKMSFGIPGAEYTPAFMMNGWDGKHHMFKRRGNVFPTGFLGLAVQIINDAGYEPDPVDFRLTPHRLGTVFAKTDKPLWDHQIDALKIIAECSRGIIEICTGGGKCLTGNSILPTKMGFKPLRMLSDARNDGVGTYLRTQIYTPSGPEYTKAFLFQKDKPVKTVVTAFGHELTGTHNHRILIRDPKQGEVLRRLDKIKVGDIACIGRGQHCFGPGSAKLGLDRRKLKAIGKSFRCPTQLSTDLAELLGHIVSEGTTPRTLRSVDFTCANPEIMARFCKKSEKVFGITPRMSRFAAIICRKGIAGFLNSLGIYGVSKDKQIPPCIMQGSRAEVVAFLRAYFEGDGGIEKAKLAISACSASKLLISQLQLLLFNMGIICSVHPMQKCATNGSRIYRTYWRLVINGQHAKTFVKTIGFLSSEKRLRGKLIMRGKRKYNSNCDVVPFAQKFLPAIQPAQLPQKVWRRVTKKNRLHAISYAGLQEYSKSLSLPAELQDIVKSGYFYSPIVEIADAGLQDVFDVEMDTKEHVFYSNGFVSHNTSVLANAYSFADCKGLILTQSRSLLYQLRDAAKMWLGIPVGIFGDGHYEPENLTVAMTQSLIRTIEADKKTLKKDLDEFSENDKATEKLIAEKQADIKKRLIDDIEFVAIDECHHSGANSTFKVIQSMQKAYYRYGFSATGYGFRSDGRDYLTAAAVGFPIFKATVSDLVFNRSPRLVPTKIFAYDYIHTKKRYSRQGGYSAFYSDAVANNPTRNLEICKCAREFALAEMPVLIAVSQVTHGQVLEKMCSEIVGDNNAIFLYGEDNSKTREEVLNRFKTGKLPILISTLLGEGIDMPSLQAVINAKAGDSRIATIQLLGRSMRIDPNNLLKKCAFYVDIIDHGERWLSNQAANRMTIYNTEKAYEVIPCQTTEILKTRLSHNG